MSHRTTCFAALLAAALLGALVPLRAEATEPVRIAIVDSGIDATHPEFAPGQVVAWKDYINTQATPYDDHGHGTAVASRAAGATLGAFPGAQLVVAKALNSNNLLNSWGHVAQAIRWSVDQGADVVNVSIWSSIPQPNVHLFTLRSAIDYATSQGVLVVWIAGNGGAIPPSTVLPGAASPQVLVVGASTQAGTPVSYSQWDPEVLAWGQDVPIAWRFGSYATGSGTSFAAPWVAGAAARLLHEGAPADVDWLKWVLLHSASDTLYPYPLEGYGVFDANAMNAAVAVAKGQALMPSLDARDAFHLPSAGARSAQSGTLPGGALPP